MFEVIGGVSNTWILYFMGSLPRVYRAVSWPGCLVANHIVLLRDARSYSRCPHRMKATVLVLVLIRRCIQSMMWCRACATRSRVVCPFDGLLLDFGCLLLPLCVMLMEGLLCEGICCGVVVLDSSVGVGCRVMDGRDDACAMLAGNRK